ncbi:Peptidase M35 deuterolysin [Macrophomina phaseolina MS6]|uniref:deuterolysin n=1 Tax=Macrophomina phaseolina (strain MS6) TaxID=1126212 RepID=K2SJI8_MACPH|nr:Peptidase M35 deuterolysin [Macrophomina phaseolina MS6]
MADLENAILGCQTLAEGAAAAAANEPNRDPDQYVNYTRDKFNAVADECVPRAWTQGRITCIDNVFECEWDSLATTQPYTGRILICPSGFILPVFTQHCHVQDMATTVLHEVTHLYGVHHPTLDFSYSIGADVWPGCKSLPDYLAKYSAETYASYAQCEKRQAQS